MMRAVLISYGYFRPIRPESHTRESAGIMNDIDLYVKPGKLRVIRGFARDDASGAARSGLA